jgi:hypothetical protein
MAPNLAPQTSGIARVIWATSAEGLAYLRVSQMAATRVTRLVDSVIIDTMKHGPSR